MVTKCALKISDGRLNDCHAVLHVQFLNRLYIKIDFNFGGICVERCDSCRQTCLHSLESANAGLNRGTVVGAKFALSVVSCDLQGIHLFNEGGVLEVIHVDVVLE